MEPSAKTLREAKRLLEATRCLYEAVARLFNAVTPTGSDENIAYFLDKAFQLLSPEGEALPQPSEAEGSKSTPSNTTDTPLQAEGDQR